MAGGNNEIRKSVLVVGATGATGKHVVQFLLDQDHYLVKVVARSKDRMLSLLSSEQPSAAARDHPKLEITEASIMDMTQDELDELVQNCDAVVCCLGHNLTLRGIWGFQHRRLVANSCQRLIQAIKANSQEKSCKFILMGSDGVGHPNDDQRALGERVVLFLLRWLIPPHADNEASAAYLLNYYKDERTPEWCVVRPTDLQDGEPTEFDIYPKAQGSLFGGGIATRSNVAKFMVQLISDDDTWSKYKYQMPVIHDRPAADDKNAK